MTIEDIETEALKLFSRERARLTERLLESLEDLSEAQNEKVWANEAECRDKESESNPSVCAPADEVFRDARSKLSFAGPAHVTSGRSHDRKMLETALI